MSIAVPAMDSAVEQLSVVSKMQPSIQDGEENAADNDIHNVMDEQVANHNDYSLELELQLFQKRELLIDFSSLKSCLDPQRDPSDNQNSENEFDYKSFVYDTFEKKADQFSSLQSLVIRKVTIEDPCGPLDKWDQYTHLYHGIMQLSGLTELDLSNSRIHTELQKNLQLWNMQGLKKLVMDNTGLKSFPPSVGRLKNLEILSLSKNQLNSLPVTLRFCQNLKELNITNNGFRQIPGVVLHLNKLTDIKRLNNPLTSQGDMMAPHFTRSCNRSQTSNNQDKKYNPKSLQVHCTQAIFSSQLDYWNQTIIGPLQCKTLDRLANTFSLCENCNQAIPDPGNYRVEVMFVTYLGLSGVPFMLDVCSEKCQTTVKVYYGEMNNRLRQEMDEKYRREIKEATRFMKNNDIDISPETINAPPEQVQHFVNHWPNIRREPARANRRRRHKCSIM